MKLNKKKAFTLVELLVVVVIIWVLAGALMGKYQSFLQSGRDAWRQASLKEMATQLEKYRMDYGDYFPHYSGCVVNDKNNTLYKALVLSGGYMSKLPVDPVSSRPVYISTGNSVSPKDACKWHFFYASLKVSSTEDFWYFIAANTETPKGMNFLTGWDTAWNQGIKGIPSDPDGNWEALIYYSKKLCNRVVFSGSDSGCDADSWQNKWYIKKWHENQNWWWVVIGGW